MYLSVSRVVRSPGLLYNTPMPENIILDVPVPQPFSFFHTAYSHGWVVLLPNSWNAEENVLTRVHRLSDGQVAILDIYEGKGSIKVKVEGHQALSKAQKTEIRDSVSCMFRLDEDLGEFYDLCREKGSPWSRATIGMGRLLRSGSIFEDLIKVICTTNIQWGGTKRMVTNLVELLGAPYPADPQMKAFPSPEVLAGQTPEYFTEKVRMGYRGPYISELARKVSSGELDLEAWNDPNLTTAELKKKLLAVKGVGNYAAASMLMLLGLYDEIAADTVFRQFVSERYFGGEPVSDDEMLTVYQDWGKWQYLAYWFDVWMDSEEQL
jgi:3-methyladenine DNA glycosylase/8-oxoguanine DNA glycosylase